MHPPQQQPGAEANFPSVGKWRMTALPRGWIVVSNFGIRQMSPDHGGSPANVALGKDALGQADTLPGYIATQARLITHYLRNAAIAGPQPMDFPGADEAALLLVRHTAQNGVSMLHAQTYVRAGRWVGIITLTTREADLKAVRPEYDSFVRGLRMNLSS